MTDAKAARAIPAFEEYNAVQEAIRETRARRFAPQPEPPWPILAPEAFHGVAGELVRLLDPHTESDPVAITVQFLTAFGNAADRGPYFAHEADRHRLNLFVCLVGDTARGRKGTSWSYPRRILTDVDPVWAGGCISNGLVSGEGMVWDVRDGTSEKDPGVQDKRRLFVESEFASVLKAANRDGSTLSPLVRQAWDGGDLKTLRRNDPSKATAPHISIIAHITKEELRRNLVETECANGFGNRFLWACVRRSKLLPEGGCFEDIALGPVVRHIRDSLAFALDVKALRRDPAAKAAWADVYASLTADRPGLVGALTARAEAQVTRISNLYAVLDQSAMIRPAHLSAALALWDYCEKSVYHIFGAMVGDRLADEIDAMLRTAGETGLTRTDIHNAFHRHTEKTRIESALTLLDRLGRAEVVMLPPGERGGRPVEKWVSSRALSAKSAITPPLEAN